tara:strand:+ start:128 stop:343 length:216 start_codon:yes stop_codon:yes gene_type:complete
MPWKHNETCDCGKKIDFFFRSQMEFVICPKCKKEWVIDVWTQEKREPTEGDYIIATKLSRSKGPLNIERGK